MQFRKALLGSASHKTHSTLLGIPFIRHCGYTGELVGDSDGDIQPSAHPVGVSEEPAVSPELPDEADQAVSVKAAVAAIEGALKGMCGMPRPCAIRVGGGQPMAVRPRGQSGA